MTRFKKAANLAAYSLLATLATALMLAGLSSRAYAGGEHQIFNLGNPDNDVSIADLARQVAEIFERSAPRAPKARFEHVTAEDFYGPGYADTDERIPDVSKARRLLGWSPGCSLADMLPGIVIDYIERYSERVAAAAPLGLSKLASSA